ncbi:hypothetical protein ZHAS_00020985 [Anopheles sinensis]|uniref:Uncharacterized protein n=1 Tax=Anopheles sinensis TaxID=74873 RepID=A0A084WR66_ANOSI|nr:hypothetical protein ZHAS_00020985 [Anopheles sinensis]
MFHQSDRIRKVLPESRETDAAVTFGAHQSVHSRSSCRRGRIFLKHYAQRQPPPPGRNRLLWLNREFCLRFPCAERREMEKKKQRKRPDVSGGLWRIVANRTAEQAVADG